MKEEEFVSIPLNQEGYLIVDAKTKQCVAATVEIPSLGIKAQPPLDIDIDPDQWYTPSVKYDERYYALGNFHYNPEDSEKARNPMFRQVREFQEHLKLELAVQDLYIGEYKKGIVLEHTTKAHYRKQRLQDAIDALDDYYAGTSVANESSTTPE